MNSMVAMMALSRSVSHPGFADEMEEIFELFNQESKYASISPQSNGGDFQALK
jgi:hypothetical protein